MSLIDAQTIPAPEKVKAAKLDGGLFYLYDLLPQTVAAYLAAGLAVGLIAEFDTQTHHPVLDGAAGGHLNGAKAALQLHALAAPPGPVVWCTADTNVPAVNPDDFPVAGAYLDAFASHVSNPVGIYGGADLVDWCITNHHASFGWVAGATSWSHGHKSTKGCLFQQVGGSPLASTDLDTYINGHDVTSCGLWLPGDPMTDAQAAQLQSCLQLLEKLDITLNDPKVGIGTVVLPGLRSELDEVKAALATVQPGAVTNLTVELTGTAKPA